MTTNQQSRAFFYNSIALSVATSELNNALTPHYFGLAEENTRWAGSRVKLKKEVLAMMSETKMSGGQLSYPMNAHEHDGSLPRALVHYRNPPDKQEYLVVDAWLSKGISTFENAWQIAKKASNDYVLTLKVRIPHDKKFEDLGNTLPEYYAMSVPLGMVDFLSFGLKDDALPEVGKHYAGPVHEVAAYRYSLIDQRYEGFRNRPTALLALALDTDSEMHKIVDRIRTKSGKVTMEGIRKLSKQYRWEEKFVSEESRETHGFGPRFRESVDYQEVADQFNCV